jgi:hypothetical protein
MKVKMIASLTAILLAGTVGKAQNNYMDNALNYNRLLKEKTGDGVYKLIGTYKVIGTSYLFGEKNKGDLFSPDAKAYNISLSYNTYNQEVEFYSTANPDKPLVKEPGTVDSFKIHANPSVGIVTPLKFVYGSYLGSNEKAFFMELFAGPKYSVYKRYKSDLGYVSSNYVQSELRQFDLLYDYFYLDVQKKSLKRLKTNSSAIVKEFKGIKDITPVFTADDFSVNQEAALIKAFTYLNQ